MSPLKLRLSQSEWYHIPTVTAPIVPQKSFLVSSFLTLEYLDENSHKNTEFKLVHSDYLPLH